MLNSKKQTSHRWHFDRIGGFDQVRLQTDEDWRSLSNLDPKLWAVLSCPTSAMAISADALALLDADNDSRIRVNEVVSAVQWVCDALKQPSLLNLRSDSVAVALFRQDTELGRSLLQVAQQLLDSSDNDSVNLAQVNLQLARFSQQVFNGDGVITRASVQDDPLLVTALDSVMRHAGRVEDISGQLGVDEALLASFDAAVSDRLAWYALAEERNALVLGESTLQALDSFYLVKDKIADFFTRCAIAEFDNSSVSALKPSISVYEAMYDFMLKSDIDAIAALPLANIESGASLPLVLGLNPAWKERINHFCEYVVRPLLGDRAVLTESDWQFIQAQLLPACRWREEEQGVQVAGLSIEAMQSWQEQKLYMQLQQLIQQDLTKATSLLQLNALKKLLLFLAELDVVVQNFVSMRDFYTSEHIGAFEAGKLFIDGRSMRLCLPVSDVAQHATLAHMSATFLLYCDCTRRHGADQMKIVAAVTAGDSDRLLVGRHGVFYDRYGDEWDAVVVRTIENPISVSQAFWSPYKRVGRMIATQVEKFASAREKAVEAKSSELVATPTDKQTNDAKTSAPFDIAKFAGIFAALGLAVGALGTAVATIIAGFLTLMWWQMPLVVVAFVLLVSGPSMLLAWLKLRKRNLGPLLDANGWAVNTHASISIPFGATLTQIASLPSGAKRSLIDPFAQQSHRSWWWFGIGILVMFVFFWQWLVVSENWLTKANTFVHDSPKVMDVMKDSPNIEGK